MFYFSLKASILIQTLLIGPGVDSVPSENEYQEHFRGVKAAGV
jgi:hypothetical protein